MNIKTLMRMTATTFCAVAMLSVASCSSDDNNGDEPNVGNGQTVNPGNVFQSGLPSNVGGAQIKTNSKGQVTEIKDGSDVVSFEYGAFTPTRADNKSNYSVLMKVRETDYPDYGSDIYLEINNLGFVSYAYQVYTDAEEGVDQWWFRYNNDGQLSYMKRSEGNETYEINYSNGDITKVIENEDGNRREYAISYTNGAFKTVQANKGCVMVLDAMGIDLDEMSIAYYAGLLGKATKNLPMVCDESGEYTSHDVFNWEFNSNNLPVKFWVEGNEYDAINFTW